jgi:hypothetical protein
MPHSLPVAPLAGARAAGPAKLALQRIEPAAPELPDAGKPVIELVEACRIEPVNAALRLHPGVDEVGLPQDLQMLGDRRRADVELVGDPAGRQLAAGEQLHDASARRIRESRETVHAASLHGWLN